jgi:hypothetical protein
MHELDYKVCEVVMIGALVSLVTDLVFSAAECGTTLSCDT